MLLLYRLIQKRRVYYSTEMLAKSRPQSGAKDRSISGQGNFSPVIMRPSKNAFKRFIISLYPIFQNPASYSMSMILSQKDLRPLIWGFRLLWIYLSYLHGRYLSVEFGL